MTVKKNPNRGGGDFPINPIHGAGGGGAGGRSGAGLIKTNLKKTSEGVARAKKRAEVG